MSGAQLQQRIRICRQRHEAAPHSRAFAPLADALRQAGRVEEALALLEEGLVRHPDFQSALVILGHTLLDAGRSSHACKVLTSVLAADPENVVALRLLAEDARSRRDWAVAGDMLVRLAALEPDDQRWSVMLGEARHNQAAPDPGEVPETAFATMTLVEIYLAQGYRAKAMTALRQIQARDPARQDVREKIAEIGILEGEMAGPEGADGAEAILPATGSVPTESRAAKRAAEKQSFEAWIRRIRTDEQRAP